MAYIDRWRKLYGFESDVILTACERTVLATDSHRFEYADSILTSWHKAGVHHKAILSLWMRTIGAAERAAPLRQQISLINLRKTNMILKLLKKKF